MNLAEFRQKANRFSSSSSEEEEIEEVMEAEMNRDERNQIEKGMEEYENEAQAAEDQVDEIEEEVQEEPEKLTDKDDFVVNPQVGDYLDDETWKNEPFSSSHRLRSNHGKIF